MISILLSGFHTNVFINGIVCSYKDINVICAVHLCAGSCCVPKRGAGRAEGLQSGDRFAVLYAPGPFPDPLHQTHCESPAEET